MDVRKESRHFSREIKRDAVHLVLEKGFPVRKVARDLDIHPNPLHQWRRMLLADGAFVGTGNLMLEDAEFKHLQRELDEVKEERNIIFIAPCSNSNAAY